MYPLIELEKENNNENNKILKPDTTVKAGRELLAFYLQTKFKQILAFDKKSEKPIFIDVRPDFISKFSKRLIHNPQKRFLVGITGGTASGKSTICDEIKNVVEKLNLPVSVLSTDNYFKDISELIKKFGTFDNLRDSGYDIDSPDGFQLELLRSDLQKLSDGEDILSPKYLPNGTGISVPNAIAVDSKKIIVVEGTATIYEGVNDIFDVNIYIHADLDLRKERFFQRAREIRNQDEENAKKHWEYILNIGEKYIAPYKSEADLVLNGNSDLKYFSQALEYIHAVTNNFNE